MRVTCVTPPGFSPCAIARSAVLQVRRTRGASARELLMSGPYEIYLIRHGVAENRGDAWPDDSKRPLADLEKQARRSKIALVGHEPGIGELAARLAGSRHPLEFKKGGACRIDVKVLPIAGPGSLCWFLTPRIMRSLKR